MDRAKCTGVLAVDTGIAHDEVVVFGYDEWCYVPVVEQRQVWFLYGLAVDDDRVFDDGIFGNLCGALFRDENGTGTADLSDLTRAV